MITGKGLCKFKISLFSQFESFRVVSSNTWYINALSYTRNFDFGSFGCLGMNRWNSTLISKHVWRIYCEIFITAFFWFCLIALMKYMNIIHSNMYISGCLFSFSITILFIWSTVNPLTRLWFLCILSFIWVIVHLE